VPLQLGISQFSALAFGPLGFGPVSTHPFSPQTVNSLRAVVKVLPPKEFGGLLFLQLFLYADLMALSYEDSEEID